MKKVINGKVYDTETAEEVYSWDNGCYGNDFHRCDETLYRTKKGSFFIAGSGGPLSKYARPVGSNGTSGGDGMEVLTAGEALRWLEAHGDADTIEKFFSDKIEEG